MGEYFLFSFIVFEIRQQIRCRVVVIVFETQLEGIGQTTKPLKERFSWSNNYYTARFTRFIPAPRFRAGASPFSLCSPAPPPAPT